MVTAISTLITACLSTFNEFIEGIRPIHELNELRTKGLVVSAWEDELGRLRIWAANIGAHQTGQSSLDFRLRDASHIHGQIIKLLESLLRKLQDTRAVLAEDEESDEVEVIDGLIDLEDAKTEIQELQEGLATIVDCLFQMSMLVREPAQHDLRLGSKDAEVAAFEPYDYKHVREKYPRADDALVKRLSNAITLRRKHLKYRERHAMKLRQGIDNVGQVVHNLQDVQEGGAVREGTEISNTVATDFQPNVAFDDNASDSGDSQTSYTPTSISGGNTTIPPAPESSLGGVPFECPYCFYLITVSGSHSWNKHVFQDLPPYICVAPTCLTPDKLYPTRHEWLHHSDTAHPAADSDHDAPQSDSVMCPLCMEDVERGKNYDRHLARHLQELALFILPRSDEDSGIRDSNSDFGNGGSRVSGDESSEKGDQPHEVTFVQRPLATTIGGESLGDLQSASSFGNLVLSENEAPSDTKRERNHEETRLLSQLAERRKVLGGQHIDTLASMRSLAFLYGSAGKMQEAESLLRQVVATNTSILGAETFSCMNSLGHILIRQRRLADAEELLQPTLVKEEEILGRDHPSTLRTVRLLGETFFLQSKLAEAQGFYERALAGCEKLYGSEHKFVLTIVHLLGDISERQSKLAEAQGFYERALAGCEKLYGSEHLFVLSIVQRLGDISGRQSKLVEAQGFYERALAGCEKLYGSEHKFVLTIVHLLGDISERQSKLVEAQGFYERALAGYEKLYGFEHDITTEVATSLATIFERQGKKVEANALSERVLSVIEQRDPGRKLPRLHK